MLIKQAVLERIVAGEIDTLFRKQKRPTVRSGGTLKTPVGVLDIVSVEEIDPARITTRDARRAGATSADEIRAELARKVDGTVYRVRVAPGGPDPRIALRESTDLTPEELGELLDRLDRLDARSAIGPWTEATLETIEARPHTRAPDLAEALGRDTPSFKADVRKLKSLGLTISHSPGYELSPRGEVVLAAVRRR